MGKTIRRRRKEGKTDYGARLEMLKSNNVRLIIRKTNRYIIAQFVQSDIAQDSVISAANSRMLLDIGWPKELSGSLKSKQAAYLTGLMLGAASKSKVKSAIVDIGLHRNVKKSRIYSALKGIIDSGIKIPHGKEALPSEEDLNSNEKLSPLITKLKSKIQNG